MNTPKEKAKSLVDKYWIYLRAGLLYDEEAKEDAKHCTLIAVDAIMDELTVMNYGLQYLNRMAYWNEVKEEIEKI
jgi:hypothetical protein